MFQITPEWQDIIKEGFAIIDVETTGLDYSSNEIIEIAVLAIKKGKVSKRFSTLVKLESGVVLPDSITSLTGITQKMLDTKGKPLSEALAEFLDVVGALPLVAHNSGFDEAIIKKSCNREGLTINNNFYDSMVFAKIKWKWLTSYSLANLANHLGLEPQTHRAMGDVKLLREIVRYF